MKQRLDQAMLAHGLVRTRSEAGNWIRLGKVTVDGDVQTKSGFMVSPGNDIRLTAGERYVSRAGLKLASVAERLGVDFTGKTVLDVGSSTGGFTDYALQHGAKKVYAVDVGTDQLHESLRGDSRIELYEKTDIRNVFTIDQPTRSASTASRHGENRASAPDSPWAADVSSNSLANRPVVLANMPDVVVMDVSFVSLRDILPHIASIVSPSTRVVAMVKPQFEATKNQLTKTGIVKNDRIRRDILQDFEQWAKSLYVIVDKADSDVAGAHGNRERFYLLKSTKSQG